MKEFYLYVRDSKDAEPRPATIEEQRQYHGNFAESVKAGHGIGFPVELFNAPETIAEKFS